MADAPSFPPGLNLRTASATGDAVFGLDILGRLVDELRAAAQVRRTERAWGPGVLGCSMWMDDPELIEVLGQMANACVVVTKQPRWRYDGARADALKALASSNGLAQQAYHELSELAPPVDGNRVIVGPWHRDWADNEIGAVREVGFRKVGNHLVPIVHAKIMLLGQMYWTDEHPSGHVMDVIGFRPERLWIGSANFTKSSRSSLEMGMWTTDPDMLTAARQWLLSLVAISEPLGAGSDSMQPELVPVEYDHDAMVEYMREAAAYSEWDEDDD
ncbi:MAG TPA: hypothetical protein VGE38_07560 [Nocardioides sp.]|uniref:hypothetical protein n=1 Tax=Nocardioides sp. TaxID=35761 RepID=UPI002ED95027